MRKKGFLLWCSWLLVILGLTFCVIGCLERIKTTATEVEYQITDPNSEVQEAAEKIGNLVGPAIILVKSVPGFPYAKAILGGLAIAQLLLSIILGWRKKKSDTALKEVVHGIELAKKELDKKGAGTSTSLKKALAITESTETTELVNKIRVKVS